MNLVHTWDKDSVICESPFVHYFAIWLYLYRLLFCCLIDIVGLGDLLKLIAHIFSLDWYSVHFALSICLLLQFCIAEHLLHFDVITLLKLNWIYLVDICWSLHFDSLSFSWRKIVFKDFTHDYFCTFISLRWLFKCLFYALLSYLCLLLIIIFGFQELWWALCTSHERHLTWPYLILLI